MVTQVDFQKGSAYNDPINGTPSDIGAEQFEMFKWQKKALMEMAKTSVFTNLASVIKMPKHMGKTIKRYHYIPNMEDANINTQGIDATGLSDTQKVTIKLIKPTGEDGAGVPITGIENLYTTLYAVGEGVDAAAALVAAKADAVNIFKREGVFDTNYDTSKAALINASVGWLVVEGDAVPASGNLYGSSKDIGAMMDRLPKLGEHGGRKNRVGGRRVELEGTMELFGIFHEWTREELDFDTDPELKAHKTRELMYQANELCEDMLQIDLLNSAGVVRYAGNAVSNATITGDDGVATVPTYKDLMNLSMTLDENRCDKDTKVISGSRMQDTRTIRSTRVMYIGPELQSTVEKMLDYHNAPAFISVEKYAAAGEPLPGEIGKVGQFTIVVVREMLRWEGAGKTVTTNAVGYRETNGKFDIFPMLVVGNDSFNTIGFQTDGKSSKFKIINKMPGEAVADRNDPYGMTGFSSISWYYGFLAVRPERIALLKTVAEYY